MVAEADQGGSQKQGAILFLTAVASAAIGGLLTNLMSKVLIDGSGAAASLWIWAGALLFAAIGAGTAYYRTILGYGDFPKGSQERDRYNRLRTGLRTGGYVGPVYERMLRRTLKAVDRFFDDEDQADRTLFPGAFGLKERAPLWTARAYDRCLLVALLYPIAMLLLVWVVSGHRGIAESAIGLPADAGPWVRASILMALAFMVSCFAGFLRLEGWKALVALAAGVGAAAVLISRLGPAAPAACFLAVGFLSAKPGWGATGLLVGILAAATLAGIATLASLDYSIWAILLAVLASTVSFTGLSALLFWAIEAQRRQAQAGMVPGPVDARVPFRGLCDPDLGRRHALLGNRRTAPALPGAAGPGQRPVRLAHARPDPGAASARTRAGGLVAAGVRADRPGRGGGRGGRPCSRHLVDRAVARGSSRSRAGASR